MTDFVRTTIIIPRDVHTGAKAEAKRERRSLQAQIIVWIERGIAQDRREAVDVQNGD